MKPLQPPLLIYFTISITLSFLYPLLFYIRVHLVHSCMLFYSILFSPLPPLLSFYFLTLSLCLSFISICLPSFLYSSASFSSSYSLLCSSLLFSSLSFLSLFFSSLSFLLFSSLSFSSLLCPSLLFSSPLLILLSHPLLFSPLLILLLVSWVY